jgi:glyoxylase-like metal-dependent hydrolase (beta-lactamase superfamily II)
MNVNPRIEAFYDSVTCTISYVVYDRAGGRAAIIDPVLDYDPKAGRTSTGSAERLIGFVRAQQLGVDWILETHAHADHLSAAHYLRRKLGGKVAIGDHIRQVQGVFKQLFNLEPQFATDGSQFDHLFAEGETFHIGELEGQAWFVPGHTPADMAYQFGDAVFVGDTLFMPDVGTARCDFPGGDAHTLYASIRKLLALPPQTRLFMCHDYPPDGRAPNWVSSVARQREGNIHVHDGVSEEQFVAMRTRRDAGLDMPVLILPSVQVNIRAGAFPAPECNGVSYLKIPLDAL